MVPKPLMAILSAQVEVVSTKASDGYSVGTSGGRPSGTKASDGYSISTSGGTIGPVVPKHLMAILSAQRTIPPLARSDHIGMHLSIYVMSPKKQTYQDATKAGVAVLPRRL